MIFSRMTLVSVPSTILTILASGFLADFIQPTLLIAPAFLGRAIITFMFHNVDDPHAMGAFALVSMMVVFSIIQVIALESLL